MEDVCILICIPQASASRKLSWRRGGRLMPTMMGARENPSQFLFQKLFHSVTVALFRSQIYKLGPAKKGRRSGELANLLP